MKILFASDGSAAAGKALAALIARIEWFRGVPQITLVNVHPRIPYGAARWVSKETVDDFYAEQFGVALDSARRELERAGIACTVETRVGDAAEELVAVAREGSFDCIAMGTHGHTALGNLVLGSVAQRVLATARIPILLLK